MSLESTVRCPEPGEFLVHYLHMHRSDSLVVPDLTKRIINVVYKACSHTMHPTWKEYSVISRNAAYQQQPPLRRLPTSSSRKTSSHSRIAVFPLVPFPFFRLRVRPPSSVPVAPLFTLLTSPSPQAALSPY
jgi:hypothetical protein